MTNARRGGEELATREGVAELALDYLRLLARESRSVEFEGPLLAARTAGLGAAALQQVMELRGLALEVHRHQDEQRRRAQELTALFETAGDLAALKDVDAVLQAIVARVRSLLGSDVSYLTLNDDEAGDTYMRVTNGIVAQEFKDCRMNFGEGLGGLVAETATPFWTDDYVNDSRFQHTDKIQDVVSVEGLTAILAVPLRLGQQVLGVLYAANRSPRAFSRDDVNLLLSLAAHAAIAIDSARLLTETQSALEDLKSTSMLLQRRTTAAETAEDAHDRLADIVVKGGDADDVVREIQEVVGGEISVLDADGTVLAAAASSDEHRWAYAKALRASTENRTVLTDELCAAPVQVGTGEPFVLLRTGGGRAEDVVRRILERAATVTALLLVVRRTVADTEARLRGDLLAELVSGETPSEGLYDRARRLGVDLDRPHAVVVAEPVERADRALRAAEHLAAVEHGLTTLLEHRLVVLLPDRDPQEAGVLVARTLGAGDSTVGSAGPARVPDEVAVHHLEATRCVDALLALGRRGDTATTRDLGFVGLLLGGGGGVDGFVTDRLGPVLDYDARRSTDLAATLHEWFAQGQHLGRTAKALQVHPNTVTQRLDRVAQLFDDDWQQPEARLELQLALRLARLRERSSTSD